MTTATDEPCELRDDELDEVSGGMPISALALLAAKRFGDAASDAGKLAL